MVVTWIPTEFVIQQLFKCIFNLGPRAVYILRAPRYLNPALVMSREKPMPVYAACERQYTATSGEVQVPWGGIYE